MSAKNESKTPEKQRKLSRQLLDPPQVNNFAAHLKFHLKNGTRPEGMPGKPGDEWSRPHFAAAIEAHRKLTRRYRSNLAEGSALTNLTHWLNEIHACTDPGWIRAIDKVLFGDSEAYAEWRIRLRNARLADPQEDPGTELTGQAENDEGLLKHAETHAKLEKIEILISEGRRQGVSELALREIASKIGSRMEDAPVEDVLLYINSFIDGVLLEKSQRDSLRKEIAAEVDPHEAARTLLDAGQLSAVSSPFDALLEHRRKRRAGRAREELLEDVRLLEGAAEYDRLAFNIERAADRYQQAAVLLTSDTKEQLRYLQAQIARLYEIGGLGGISAALLVLIELCRRILDKMEESARYRALSNMGAALCALGGREFGTRRLQQAIDCLNDALESLPPELEAIESWPILTNLGIALSLMGKRGAGIEYLEQGIETSRKSRSMLSREKNPLAWADVTGNLGSALSDLGKREKNIERLRLAVETHCEAMQEFAHQRARVKWASTLYNVGNTLMHVGVLESDTAELLRSVRAYRVALRVLSLNNAPEKWGEAQSNRGMVLALLGERAMLVGLTPVPGEPHVFNASEKAVDAGIDYLSQAVHAFREALRQRTRSQAPLLWADVQRSLGRAEFLIGLRQSNVQKLLDAIKAYDASAQEHSRDRDKRSWALIQRTIGAIYLSINDLKPHPDWLVQAIDATSIALEALTADAFPVERAETKINLGGAFFRLAKSCNDSAVYLNRAIGIYRSALDELPRQSQSVLRERIQLQLQKVEKYTQEKQKKSG